jgi:hypothetical protein
MTVDDLMICLGRRRLRVWGRLESAFGGKLFSLEKGGTWLLCTGEEGRKEEERTRGEKQGEPGKAAP